MHDLFLPILTKGAALVQWEFSQLRTALKFFHCLEFKIVSQAHSLLISHYIQVGVAYLKWVPPFRGMYKRILKNMHKFRGRMEALVKEAKDSFSDGEVVSLKMMAGLTF